MAKRGDFVTRAEEAEACALAGPPDEAWFAWDRAAEFWWRAATSPRGSARHFERQDAAKARANEAARLGLAA